MVTLEVKVPVVELPPRRTPLCRLKNVEVQQVQTIEWWQVGWVGLHHTSLHTPCADSHLKTLERFLLSFLILFADKQTTPQMF